MKLLWFGDLAHTGFGTVTSDVGRQFVAQGVDVRFLSQNDIGQLAEPFLSRTLDVSSLLKNDQGVTGVQDFIPDLLAGKAGRLKLANGKPWGGWTPDAVFLLGDFYGMRMMAAPYLDAFAKVPTFHYVPIEGHDLPPLWAEMWSVIKPVAMTKFGQAQIEQVVGYSPPLVYHGVDADAFHPVSTTNPIVITETDADGKETRAVLNSKAACKVFLRLPPTCTFVLRTDRNMPRKGYPALIRAMAPVMRERPNVILGLHTQIWDQGGDLRDSLSKCSDVSDRMLLSAHLPVPREILLAMYNAADLYVSTSAEGFGLTIAEALACGVPAVGLDYSAVPEVIGPAGALVPVGRLLDNEYAHHWALPDEDAFGRTVAYLIDHPHKRLELGRLGPAHIARDFRWDVAAERFTTIAQDALQGNVTPFPNAVEVAA